MQTTRRDEPIVQQQASQPAPTTQDGSLSDLCYTPGTIRSESDECGGQRLRAELPVARIDKLGSWRQLQSRRKRVSLPSSPLQPFSCLRARSPARQLYGTDQTPNWACMICERATLRWLVSIRPCNMLANLQPPQARAPNTPCAKRASIFKHH